MNKLASAEIRKNFAITTKLDKRIKKIINLKLSVYFVDGKSIRYPKYEPKNVATPFPPLNLWYIGKQCPRTLANPNMNGFTDSTKKIPKAMLIIPFNMSPAKTPAAYFLPRTLSAFDDPGLPLPTFLMSMPLYLLIIIAKFTDPKR